MGDLFFIVICIVTAGIVFSIVGLFVWICNCIANAIRRQDIEKARLRKLGSEGK